MILLGPREPGDDGREDAGTVASGYLGDVSGQWPSITMARPAPAAVVRARMEPSPERCFSLRLVAVESATEPVAVPRCGRAGDVMRRACWSRCCLVSGRCGSCATVSSTRMARAWLGRWGSRWSRCGEKLCPKRPDLFQCLSAHCQGVTLPICRR